MRCAASFIYTTHRVRIILSFSSTILLDCTTAEKGRKCESKHYNAVKYIFIYVNKMCICGI